jgi:hypothetical protein
MKNEIMPESASFKSKDSVRKISQPILHNSPPVGSYNPSDIYGPWKNEANGGKNANILTMRPGYKDKDPVPFNSETLRFTESKVKTNRGPGHYDPPSVFDIQKQKLSSKLFSESHRFEQFGSYIDHRRAR